jgi:hypothetical protein
MIANVIGALDGTQPDALKREFLQLTIDSLVTWVLMPVIDTWLHLRDQLAVGPYIPLTNLSIRVDTVRSGWNK